MGDILNRRWNFDEVNKIVSRDETVDSTGGPTVAANRNQVNELYSAIQDQIDEPSFMTSRNPMTAETPELYTKRNGWFIDARSTEWLEGSAIQTNGWAGNIICAISFNATTMFGAADIGRTITGGDGDAGIILGFDDRYTLNDEGVLYIRPTTPASDLFDNPADTYTVGGSSAAGSFTGTFDAAGSRTGENLIANPFTLGAAVVHTEFYIYQDSSRVVSREVNPTQRLQWWDTDTTVEEGHIDILLTVQEAGTLIDSGLINIYARRPTSLYDHFQSNQSGGTRTPVPIAQGNDNLNDSDGFREMVTVGTSSGNWNVGDRIEDDTDDTIRGVITAVAGTNPNIELQYYLIGDPLNDFTGATGTFSNLDDTGAATAVAPTNVNGAVASGITITFGETSVDISNGAGLRPYSITIDCNSQPLADVYRRTKYLTRRGELATLNNEPGETYKGNAIRVDYDTQAGGNWVEGNLVYGQDSTPQPIARIVADLDNGTDGTLMLSSVKGVFADTEQIGDAATAPTITANLTTATQTSIAGLTPKRAPFGDFAGGNFFGAIGVVLINVAGGEATNYQLTDNLEQTQIPPSVISIAVTSILARSEGTATSADAGTVLNDTAATFITDGVEVDDIVWNIRDGSRAKVTIVNSEIQLTHTALAGGVDDSWDQTPDDEYAVMYGDTALVARVDGTGEIITNAFNSHATNNVAGDVTLEVDAIATDEPDSGVAHMVGVDEANDFRYRYATRTATIFTLVVPTDSTGNPTTTDATNGVEEMFDTTADFAGAAEPVRVGDSIRNETDGGYGVITGVFKERLTHTPLIGGTNNDWNTADTYRINALIQTYDASDTGYVAVIDARNITEGTTELSNTLTFDTAFDVTIRVRQSGKMLDFISSGNVGSGGLAVSAVRAPDTIFIRPTPT